MQYRRRDSLARIYELSTRFVDRLAKEMEQLERYPKDTILKGRGYVLIEEDAFRDYLQYRTRLGDPTLGEMVAPYERPKPQGEEIYVLGGTR